MVIASIGKMSAERPGRNWT